MKVYIIFRGVQRFSWDDMAYYTVDKMHSVYETEEKANSAMAELVLKEKETYVEENGYFFEFDDDGAAHDDYGIEIPHDVFRIQPYEVL